MRHKGGTNMQNEKSDMKRCCNTCIYKDDSFYGCSKANVCYNGFSAYSPKTKETNE
ncbi:MAG: hypothetical protein ACFFDF_20965 [Candidatus Odinarchaeota archaeon]